MSGKLRDLEKPSKYKDFLRSIASIQVKHPFITLGILLAVTIMLIGGVAKVETVASLEKMMPSDIEEIKAFNSLRDQGLGQDMLGVIIELDQDSAIMPNSDILSYEHYTYVKMLKNVLASENDIVSAYAFSDIIDAYGPPVGRGEYLQLIQLPQVQTLLESFVNKQKTNTVIMIATDVAADDTRMKLLAEKIRLDVDSAGSPPATKISITGTPVIQQRLGEVIEHDRKMTERVSALFVFIAVAIVFGSIIAAFVPMVSIILSIIWLYGAMGYLGLPISTLAGGVAAMVIGIGVDFSIHLRNKFEYERKKGESLAYAVEETMANTGYVLTHVTIVTALAFMAFTLGEMPEMGRFGLLMTIGVGLAFLLSVVGLPALFIAEEKAIYWVKNHIRFGVENELVLATSSSGKKTESELKGENRASKKNRL